MNQQDIADTSDQPKVEHKPDHNIEQKDPVFQKLDTIKPGKHGYNTYLKVISSTLSDFKKADGTFVQIADGVVGDETATIKFYIRGDYAKLLQVNSIIAIRNGRSQVANEQQRLELDKWGKITEEKDIKIDIPDNVPNLSNVKYEIKVVPRDQADDDRQPYRGFSRGQRGRGRYRNNNYRDQRNRQDNQDEGKRYQYQQNRENKDQRDNRPYNRRGGNRKN